MESEYLLENYQISMKFGLDNLSKFNGSLTPVRNCQLNELAAEGISEVRVNSQSLFPLTKDTSNDNNQKEGQH
jgi:hypothetical protein